MIWEGGEEMAEKKPKKELKTTEAQRRAIAKYEAAYTKRITVKFNMRTEADVLAKIESVDNMQGYIKQLIRDDIAKNQ